jgi:hypothetical protein
MPLASYVLSGLRHSEKRKTGSHRQFKRLARPGRVTVAGKPGDDVARNAEQDPETGWVEEAPVQPGGIRRGGGVVQV